MTSVYDGTGTTFPVTLIRPFKMVVTQIKYKERDGYNAIQLAYQETTEKHINKPKAGILRKAGVKGCYRRFFEAKVPEEDLSNYHLGQVIDPSEFLDYWGEVDVWAISKGKGFAGAMKRHGFKGEERTHGEPDERRPMSSGATDPARVFPGTRKPGHMGAVRVSISDLSCFEYNSELNLLAIQGSIPGPAGGIVTLKLKKLLTEKEVEEIKEEREQAKKTEAVPSVAEQSIHEEVLSTESVESVASKDEIVEADSELSAKSDETEGNVSSGTTSSNKEEMETEKNNEAQHGEGEV